MTQYNKIHCLRSTCELCMYLTPNQRISFYNQLKSKKINIYIVNFLKRAAAAVATFLFSFQLLHSLCILSCAYIVYIDYYVVANLFPKHLKSAFYGFVTRHLNDILSYPGPNAIQLFIYSHIFYYYIDISRTFI